MYVVVASNIDNPQYVEIRQMFTHLSSVYMRIASKAEYLTNF
jgi:hypothetical protein